MQAQSVSEWLQTARADYESGDCRTVLTNVAKIEDAVGGNTCNKQTDRKILLVKNQKKFDCLFRKKFYLCQK